MSQNPVNLGLRFILEMAALVAIGFWGWNKTDGWLRWLTMLGLPLLTAILWGVFRIPNDPGNAIIAISGVLRLILEIVIFSFAVWTLFNLHHTAIGLIFGIILIIHYLISYDRILWMIRM